MSPKLIRQGLTFPSRTAATRVAIALERAFDNSGTDLPA
jgi:hypothetical protein